MSTKYVYICDHCGAECTDKFEIPLFGKWARKDAQPRPDNVHGCTREHTILAVAKILGIGIDGSARDMIEQQRVELQNLRFKLQKLENANEVNLARIAALESRQCASVNITDPSKPTKPLRVDSIGTCSICGYYGPGPAHDCQVPK